MDDNSELSLSGPVTLATVTNFFADGKARAERADLTVDFSAVTSVDSAALAALFAWMRAAEGAGHVVSVRALPEDANSLAKLYGVDDLLPASV